MQLSNEYIIRINSYLRCFARNLFSRRYSTSLNICCNHAYINFDILIISVGSIKTPNGGLIRIKWQEEANNTERRVMKRDLCTGAMRKSAAV